MWLQLPRWVFFFFSILREQRQRILLLIYNKGKGSCLATVTYIGTSEKLAKFAGPHQANKTENSKLRGWILVYLAFPEASTGPMAYRIGTHHRN